MFALSSSINPLFDSSIITWIYIIVIQDLNGAISLRVSSLGVSLGNEIRKK